jgi:formylglycine-generating enzyme required for sulfatase activity
MTTIKAKAFKLGWSDSPTTSTNYTISIPIPENFVFVQGGTFSRQNEDGSYPNPPVMVTLSSFYIDKYEVTQTEFQAVMGFNPSNFSGNPNRPVEQVRWTNAIEYCNRRSMQEGLTPCYSYGSYGTDPDNWPEDWVIGDNSISCNWSANGYRLPTEMEWMFAAKGGNQSQGYTYSGSNDIYAVAWYNGNSGFTTHTVGTKAPNELGTFDMSGNVYEWCWDWYSSSYYTISPSNNPTGPASGAYCMARGGSWAVDSFYCRIANRGPVSPYRNRNDIGFRVCRSAP